MIVVIADSSTTSATPALSVDPTGVDGSMTISMCRPWLTSRTCDGASVLAYPSRYEGFGLVPLEAMAVGTPVVATRVGAIAEVAGEAALLVPERDRDALADALHAVLHDPLIAERLIDDGTSRAAAFTWDAAVDGVVELYRRAVDAR